MPTQNELLANVVRLYRGQEPEFEHGSEEKLKEVFGASRAYQDVPALRALLRSVHLRFDSQHS